MERAPADVGLTSPPSSEKSYGSLRTVAMGTVRRTCRPPKVGWKRGTTYLDCPAVYIEPVDDQGWKLCGGCDVASTSRWVLTSLSCVLRESEGGG